MLINKSTYLTTHYIIYQNLNIFRFWKIIFYSRRWIERIWIILMQCKYLRYCCFFSRQFVSQSAKITSQSVISSSASSRQNPPRPSGVNMNGTSSLTLTNTKSGYPASHSTRTRANFATTPRRRRRLSPCGPFVGASQTLTPQPRRQQRPRRKRRRP